MLGSPATTQGCESCHSEGLSDVEKGGGKGVDIFAFGKKVSSQERSARCLSCHEESKEMMHWDIGKHGLKGISCDRCHSGHASMEKEPELCFDCYKDIKAQTNKQSHPSFKES